MASFLSIIEGVAKLNKVFTFANVAFDASITGVQIAQAVDPESVCVAWDVKDLSTQAFDKGKEYDDSLDKIAQTSTDMENIRNAIGNVQSITESLRTRWDEMNNIRKKIDEISTSLASKVPGAHAFLLDLQRHDGDTKSEVKKVTDQLKAKWSDVAINSTFFGVTVVGLVGVAVYQKYFAPEPPSRFKILFDSQDPKWRLKEVTKQTVSTLFNVGSFAMNIWIVINLAKQCQQQADTLRGMISNYDKTTPTLKYLLKGCKEDKEALDRVKKYLKTIDETSSFDDSESEKLLKAGLTDTLSNYNTNVDGWMTDLDKIYQMILNIFTAAAAVDSTSKDLAQKLDSGYKDFGAAKTDFTDKTKTSLERLGASRNLVEITSRTISSATNSIVKEYQVALEDTKSAQYLVDEAEVIAGWKSRLEDFNKDKLTYVVRSGYLRRLDSDYPDRSVFKAVDATIANQQIADFMEQAIQNILNP